MTIETNSPARNVEALLSDEQVASLLNLSVAWLRKQRHLRKKGEGHVFAVEPVFVGSKPRYRAAEVHAWLNSL